MSTLCFLATNDLQCNMVELGNSFELIDRLPDNSLFATITSVPYWNVRNYGTDPQIFDGNPKCKHIWIEFNRKGVSGGVSNKTMLERKGVVNFQIIPDAKEGICMVCGAWKGEFGREPFVLDHTFEFEDGKQVLVKGYISHLVELCHKILQKTRLDGTLWLNIGDTYSTQSGQCRDTQKKYDQYASVKLTNRMAGIPLLKSDEFPDKSLCLIPNRFAQEMLDRYGYIVRNEIILRKINGMPSSIPTKFTHNYEKWWFIVKNNKPLYWVNQKSMILSQKYPKGIKGVENEDWRWEICEDCLKKIEEDFNKKKNTDSPKSDDGITEKPIPIKPKADLGAFINPKKFVQQQKAKMVRKHSELFIKYLEPMKNDFWFLLQGEQDIALLFNTVSNITQERVNSLQFNSVCGKKSCVNGKTKRTLWKSYDYYFEQQFETLLQKFHKFTKNARNKHKEYGNPVYSGFLYNSTDHLHGKNKRAVWDIIVKGTSKQHFATFSEDYISTPIEASVPMYYCTTCGCPRIKVYEFEKTDPIEIYSGKARKDYETALAQNPSDTKRRILESMRRIRKLKGYSHCLCEHPTYAIGFGFDPFLGSGSLAVELLKRKRGFYGFELKREYYDMAMQNIKPLIINKRIDQILGLNIIK